MRPVAPACQHSASFIHQRSGPSVALLLLTTVALALIPNSLSAAPQSPPTELPTLHARVASSPITIDGKLNEAAWQQAEPVFLTQQSPRPGQPTPYKTEVRVLISGDSLVFGFRCVDPKPSAIATHTLAVDGDMIGDDTVSIALDSFGDRRTGYFFQINAAAARFDGLISGPSDFSLEWDGIWDGKSSRTPEGWSAEIRIPAQTLTFGSGKNRWGLELDRSIARDQTELRWASPSLDADLVDMSRAGYLELEVPLKQGHGLEFAPYLSGSMPHDFLLQRRNWLASEGGELTWRITPQLAGVLTVNTDFAETEVDSRQINPTPFPIPYPEKRAFFLEGANQYTYGLELSNYFVPFYSRNIGLLDGYNIPLQGGIKINGHAGPWSIGVLDVQTRDSKVPDYVVQDLGLPSNKVAGTNLLASRIAYDIDKHLRVGTMLTHGDPEALLSNTLAGADAVWHTSTFLRKRSLLLGGWAATTQGDLPKGNREAWGIRADYPNDLVNCALGFNKFGPGFEPLLGFIPRPSTQQTAGACSFRPRPSPSGPFRAIRQASYDSTLSHVTDNSGNLQSLEVDLNPVHLTFNSGDMITAGVILRHENLSSPFFIVPTVSYSPGSLDFQRFQMIITTSPQRQLQFIGQTYAGGYYKGNMFHQYAAVNWTPVHGKVSLGVVADDYFGHTPNGNWVEKLWQFHGALALNPDVSLSSFIQYDNISFSLSSNTRFRWTLRPGNDVFLIWNRTWTRDISRSGINIDPTNEGLTAKIRWTFRL